jgi:TonB family protein
MSTIASEWRMRRLGDIQHPQPISGVRPRAHCRLWRQALSAALVRAQQNPQRVQEGPAAAPAPVSPSRAAPSQNVSHWQQALVARLDRFKRYPARAHGTEGVASVAFTIDRKGNVLSSKIATSSGSSVLDAEVLALVKRAAPFPPPPADARADLLLPLLLAKQAQLKRGKAPPVCGAFH